MSEIWKTIDEAPEYLISSFGRVKHVRKTGGEIFMGLLPNKDGYLKCHLTHDGKNLWRLVHRLVAKAFLQNHEQLPVVNHKNGIVTDNRVTNLEWCSHQYNCWHSRHVCVDKTLQGKDDYISAVNVFTGESRRFSTLSECGRFYHIRSGYIKAAIRGCSANPQLSPKSKVFGIFFSTHSQWQQKAG